MINGCNRENDKLIIENKSTPEKPKITIEKPKIKKVFVNKDDLKKKVLKRTILKKNILIPEQKQTTDIIFERSLLIMYGLLFEALLSL